MRIIGCDLHARQQTLAMLDTTTTGGVVEVTLQHEGDNVREFYSSLPGPVRVGIEATGSMQWFSRISWKNWESNVWSAIRHRFAQPSHGSRNMIGEMPDLILKLLAEDRFPAIWLPSKELQDLRSLLRHRHPSGYACGREYKMRCSRLPWRMVSDEAPPCGATTDKAGSHHCRWRLIPLIGGVSCKRCTKSSKQRSKS